MQPLQNAGYDRAITVFSPDGRLFQVEYAREAVKRGTTSIGIKCSEGIILAVDKRTTSSLVEASSIEKIFKIDEHIGAATSGLVADARALVERARVEAQINKITYSEPIRVDSLSKKLCDMLQLYTQNGGVRPFGSALIIGGVYDGKSKLFETDPSGALIEYKATAIGSGRAAAMEIFEEEYSGACQTHNHAPRRFARCLAGQEPRPPDVGAHRARGTGRCPGCQGRRARRRNPAPRPRRRGGKCPWPARCPAHGLPGRRHRPGRRAGGQCRRQAPPAR